MPWWLQALIAVATAVSAGTFSYVQWRLAQNKLKLDLFDRRHAIFRVIAAHLSKIAQTGTVIHDDDIALLQGTRDAVFLFGPEMKAWIDGIYDRCVDLETVGTESSQRWTPERAEEARLLKNQILRDLKEMPERFSPFLSISHEPWPWFTKQWQRWQKR